MYMERERERAIDRHRKPFIFISCKNTFILHNTEDIYSFSTDVVQKENLQREGASYRGKNIKVKF